MSNDPSSNGRAWISASWKVIFVTPSACARARAPDNGSATYSTPVTEPPGTSLASEMLIEPGPQPTSRILCVGWMCGIRWGAEFWAVRQLWVWRTVLEWSVV